MLNKLKRKQNKFAQKIHYAYNHDIRRIICITTGLTTLLCKISLQFYCEFIDNNRLNIYLISKIAQFVKLLTSILYIGHSAFVLYDLIKDYRGYNKKELLKILGKSTSLINSSIKALMILKAFFHFLTGSNKSAIDHIHLTSTILLLFITEPISYYYTYKEYQESCKKYLDKKETYELKKYKNELNKQKKNLFISALTLSLGLLNFILKRIEITTTPINLYNGVIYNFNLSITITIIYSVVFLAIHLDKLFSQPINDDPNTGLYDINYIESNRNLINSLN